MSPENQLIAAVVGWVFFVVVLLLIILVAKILAR